MELEITKTMLMWGFIIAAVMGAVVNKTNFCTMGAVSDVVNIGDTGRMRAWVFAMATAILGVFILDLMGLIDMGLTQSGETAKPPYRTSMFMWPRYILGGVLFGIGMTLGSGCGNKTLVRAGGGNIKSIVVLLCMGLAAYIMIFTSFDYYAFIQWMQPAFINFAEFGANSQDIGSVLAAIVSGNAHTFYQFTAVILAVLLILWALKSTDFRGSFDNIFGGLVVGLAVVAAWYITAGPMGQTLLEEVEFLDADEIPFNVGAQSMTFVQPSAHLVRYIETGFSPNIISFALALGAGVIFGSFLYSLLFRKFKIEWFSSFKDVIAHVIGGILMGIGGVLSLGCTIGQAVTGVSTLALGSFVTFAAIVFGSALTMKIQYYKMVYEDDATFLKALVAGLADMHLLPNSLRKLEAV